MEPDETIHTVMKAIQVHGQGRVARRRLLVIRVIMFLLMCTILRLAGDRRCYCQQEQPHPAGGQDSMPKRG